jgi:Fe-S cluster biosynthesis and repair protein YggX
MPDTIKCTHCGEKRPGLPFAPFPNELGQRIAAEICQPCWSGWLQKQTQIINHYGLDLTNPDAQNFLFDNIKGYLFGDVPTKQKKDLLNGSPYLNPSIGPPFALISPARMFFEPGYLFTARRNLQR